jgi:HAD superfamily hydrolase (TIGR01509 family)
MITTTTGNRLTDASVITKKSLRLGLSARRQSKLVINPIDATITAGSNRHIMHAYTVNAVLFDFDGTLTQPGAIDFRAVKQSIGCPPDQPILEFIRSMRDDARQAEANAVLHAMELEAARRSRPNGGVDALVRFLRARQLPIGILTRNSRASVMTALKQFSRLSIDDFNVVITRDDPVQPKPHPAGVLLAAERFQVDPQTVLVVGDFHFDIDAGRQAGALTALLDEGHTDPEGEIACDFRVTSLSEIERIVRCGRPLPNGKFPNDLLEEFFGHLQHDERRFLIKPGIGEDTAAIDIAHQDTLVVTSDPITFVTDQIGTYSVLINANDIATSGAIPQWLMTTLLFPPDTTPSAVFEVMTDINAACRHWGITLCGGHTEITDAVQRPVVMGTLGAAMARQDLIDKRNMRPGDRVLLTKGVAVEGTAIIANAFADRLLSLGLTAAELEDCRGLVDQISILPEAAVARRMTNVTAMHDVTEGGIAAAIYELSCAGGHQLDIHLERIPVLPVTDRVCRLLDVDPLGLIGSGSLLIACRPDTAEALMAAIEAEGIPVAWIGDVSAHGQGVKAHHNGERVSWPEFEVDEIARLF